jgi:hypothetical protein
MTDYSESLNMMSALGQQPVTLLGEVSVEPLAAVGIIETALTEVKDNLTEFAASPSFETDMLTVFGESADVDLGETIIDALAVGEDLPQIIVVPVERMNGANGGFDSLTGTVYLADSLINPNSVIASETKQFPNLANVLTEELGHYIDSKLNLIDTPGDEGALFGALVRGEKLSPVMISELKRESDRLYILNNSLPVEASIDVEWVKQLGTAADEWSYSLARDKNNNLYITGFTEGSLEGSNKGKWDAILAKYNSEGDRLWTKQIATPEDDYSYDIATDKQGNVYIAGHTEGKLGERDAKSQDAWVAKYNKNGQQMWIEQLDGGFSSDYANAVAADNRGNVYITGKTWGNLGGSNVGEGDIWVAKYNKKGNKLWVKQFGTSAEDVANEIALDKRGNIYLVGNTSGSLGNSYLGGNTDIFVAKLDRNGELLWTVQNGTSGDDNAEGIAIDKNGNIYATGYTNGDWGGTNQGSEDSWLVKYNKDGQSLWTRKLGSGGSDWSNDVTVDVNNNVYITGLSGGFLADGFTGGFDAFMAKYNADGDEIWKRQIGTSENEFARGIAVDTDGNMLYVTGDTTGDFGGSNAGVRDLFVAKLNQNLPSISIKDVTVREGDKGTKIARVPVSLEAETNEVVEVSYSTANGKAKNKRDYQQTRGTLVFEPGDFRKFIEVPIVGDKRVELEESFKVNLRQPVNGFIEDGQGIVTITDGDRPTISINNPKIKEGDSGVTEMQFTVSLNAQTDRTVKVGYATEDKTAVAGEDYQEKRGTIVFKPGETKQTISIPITGDKDKEKDEKFEVVLSKAKNAILGTKKKGIATIKNDDKSRIIDPDGSFELATNLGTVSVEPEELVDSIGLQEGNYRDTNDFYRFRVGGSGTLNLFMDGMLQDANVEVYGSGEELISSSKEDGLTAEFISVGLDKGSYFVRVFPQGGDRTPYRLSLNFI